MEPYRNNKHFQGFSKKSADRWGLGSFLDTETDFEEQGEVGSTLGDSVLPLPGGKEPAGAVNSKHPGLVGAVSWAPGDSVPHHRVGACQPTRSPSCMPLGHQPQTRLQPVTRTLSAPHVTVVPLAVIRTL